ncbi:hypothetical protein N7G274_007761 [Stereocaulon virgatum]|uniref:Uncharacterized protein n=1 Tax=Stereocaulon virgatum TaxID=373712 RepID=A0ABR4A1X6_9LECA
MEDKINIAGDAAWPFVVLAYNARKSEPFWRLKENLSYPYFIIEDYERTEWLVTHMQNDIEAHFGADSKDAVLNTMHVALRHLRAKCWERAEPLFNEALRRAETVLQPDDPIRAKIAKCLVDHEYESVCSVCKILSNKDLFEIFENAGIHVQAGVDRNHSERSFSTTNLLTQVVIIYGKQGSFTGLYLRPKTAIRPLVSGSRRIMRTSGTRSGPLDEAYGSKL